MDEYPKELAAGANPLDRAVLQAARLDAEGGVLHIGGHGSARGLARDCRRSLDGRRGHFSGVLRRRWKWGDA